MKAKDIYNLAVKMGIDADPRGRKEVDKILKKEKEKYEKMDKDKKENYDISKLENPYSDSRLLLDDGEEVKKILTGIDMDTAEMILADKLGADMVIGHHPLGVGLAELDGVMKLQADVLADYGVPINIAESLMEKRMAEVSRRISPANNYQSVDAAKILNLSLMCTHTIADNMVYKFIRQEIDKSKPETVGEILKTLEKIPEYKEAAKQGAGSRIFAGNPDRRCGKIAVTEVTGGTSGSKDIYERMSHFGIGTIISMHIDEEYRAEAEKHHINVIVAGHISSDSIGMNLFLDELQKKNIEIIPCSGLIRISRV